MKKTLKSWAAGARRRDIIKRAAKDVQRGVKDADRGDAARAAARKNLSAKTGR